MSQAPDERRLFDVLATFDSVIVAFSGGVDSAYLAWAATEVLGRSRALCVTAESPSYPDRHRQLARSIARQVGLHHEIIHTGEVDRPDYRANPTNRCYFCKQELYGALSALATTEGSAPSWMAPMPTIVATIARAARRLANLACGVPSTRRG